MKKMLLAMILNGKCGLALSHSLKLRGVTLICKSVILGSFRRERRSIAVCL